MRAGSLARLATRILLCFLRATRKLTTALFSACVRFMNYRRRLDSGPYASPHRRHQPQRAAVPGVAVVVLCGSCLPSPHGVPGADCRTGENMSQEPLIQTPPSLPV